MWLLSSAIHLYHADQGQQKKEIAYPAAIGAAAMYVPFPFAVDDHQTSNANFLVSQGAGWLLPQADLTPQNLAERLMHLSREQLLACAEKAFALKKLNATREVVAACEELAL